MAGYIKKTSKRSYHWKVHKYSCIDIDPKKYAKELSVYRSMCYRCSSEKSDMYYCYGARGIKVCDRWSGDKGFINFYNDMGARPVDKNGKSLQIDRIDPDGDYCPENCRWVTAEENAKNKRRTIFVYLWGDKYCASDACKILGINRTTVTERVRIRGNSPTEALAAAVLAKNKKIEHMKGEK